MKIENTIQKIENIQSDNTMGNRFLNKNTVLKEKNKDNDNNSFKNIFNNIANEKDE